MDKNYKQIRSEILDHAGATQDLGVAFGVARRVAGEAVPFEIDAITRRVLLDLFDEGLVFFFFSDYERGYAIDPEAAEPLDRDTLLKALSDPEAVVQVPERLVFFRETAKGAALFRGTRQGPAAPPATE